MTKSFYILTLLFISASFLFGQSGKVNGYIHDVNKDEALVLATILIGSEKVVTDFDGEFEFQNLPIGHYQIKIIGNEQKDTLMATIDIEAGSTSNLYFSYPYSCPYIKARDICPICSKTDMVIPIIYGEPTSESMSKAEDGKIRLAGCLVSTCDPNWYCKRDKKEF